MPSDRMSKLVWRIVRPKVSPIFVYGRRMEKVFSNFDKETTADNLVIKIAAFIDAVEDVTDAIHYLFAEKITLLDV